MHFGREISANDAEDIRKKREIGGFMIHEIFVMLATFVVINILWGWFLK